MEVVTVSPKFQVVIPLKIRESLRPKPDQKVQVILYNNRIELIPIAAAQQAHGFLRGNRYQR